MQLRTRHIFAASLVALAVGVSACGGTPPGLSGTPSTPGSTPPCTGTARGAATSAPAATGQAGTAATTPAELGGTTALDTSEAVAAADVAAADSLGPDGTGEVAVVVVADGRPEIVTVPAADAVAAASDLSAGDDTQVVAVDDVVRVGLESGTAPIASDPRRIEQWAMDDLSVEDAWAAGTGAGVDIAVIDSGVSGAHKDFDDRICSGVAYLNDSGRATVGSGAVDGHGHGTHVAGIAAAGADNGIGVAGVAPDARIIPVRVLGNDGKGFSSDVSRGIIWAVDHGAEVINLSLGGDSSADITAAVDYAIAKKVVVVAAAGNDGPTGPANYPAALPDVIAVASYGADRALSSFSTHGSYVDVAAPGYDILSTASNGSYKRMSGTSMATPHVAGLAAILAQSQPTLGPAAVQQKISTSAIDAGPIGRDDGFGQGIIDLVATVAP